MFFIIGLLFFLAFFGAFIEVFGPLGCLVLVVVGGIVLAGLFH